MATCLTRRSSQQLHPPPACQVLSIYASLMRLNSLGGQASDCLPLAQPPS